MSDYVMDEETRRRLVGILPYGAEARDQYTPQVYRDIEGLPEDAIPVFTLRPLTAAEKREARERMRQSEGLEDYMYALASAVIVGWSKLVDVATGRYVPFKAGKGGSGADSELVQSLNPTVVSQIIERACALSGLVAVDKLPLVLSRPSTPES